MASSILSRPYPSRPLLPASRCLLTTSSSSRRCIHLSSARSFVTTDSALLSSALASPSSPASPFIACDSNLRPDLDPDVDARPQNDGSQQSFRNILNPEPRLDSSLNAVQGTMLDRSSVGQAESETTLSSGEDGSAVGFRFREPTEYDFEIYASNSMEGFEQPPPPLPRFSAVFEDYWGEVIGEDTRPKGDEASIRIRNGLLKYLEGLKEAEDKENKTKSRPLFSGSRANNRSRPIQSYSDFLASKEREANTLPQSSSVFPSGASEDVNATDSDRAGAGKPTENVATSIERKFSGPTSGLAIEVAKSAEGKIVPGDSDALGPLPRSRVNDARPAERITMPGNRTPSNFTDADSVAEANSTEKSTILGDGVTSTGYGNRDAEHAGRDSMLGKSNFRSPTEGYVARDTMRGQRDTGFAMSNSSNSVHPAARSRDRNSGFSRNRPIDSIRPKEFDKGEAYDVIGRLVTPRLENTHAGAEDVVSTVDAESVGNASINKPGDTFEGSNSSLDSKPWEDRWSGDRVGDDKPAIKPVEDRWPRNRFGDVEPAGKPVERNWSGDRSGDSKPAYKPVEERLAGDKFGGVKPADRPVDDWRADDRFKDVKPAGMPMEGRGTGDRFGNVNLDSLVDKSSLSESRPVETISKIVPEPLEIVVDSEGTDRLMGTKQVGWEMNLVSTARLVDSKRVDSSMNSKPRELEGNSVSTSDLPATPFMHADPQVSMDARNDPIEALRHFSEEETVSYVPRVRDVVLGAVISGSDEKLELEIGAGQPGLLLSKDLRLFSDTNLENSFFELPSIDECQKLEGFVAPLGKSLIVDDRTAYNGASSISSIVDFGTVLTAEVQGLTLGDGRAILSARPPAQRMAWHRIKQLMQVGEAVNIQIVQYNEGGVLGFLEGVRSFLPRSELLQRPENTAALSKYIGRTLPVVILQADEDTGNMIISEFMAWKRKNLQLGTVHDATVTRVYSYGMQVEVNNTRLRGFVHISNISKEYVKRVADLFTEGEKIKVMLIRGRDAHQVSFSIGELESDRGLIFRNKERVFLEAEEMARQFQENLSEDDRQLFSQPVRGVEAKLEGPGIANMNWLHLGDEV